jgi:hypothetical protein
MMATITIDPFCALPDELLLATCLWLGGRDLCRLEATCRRWRRIVDDPRLWRQLFQREFGQRYTKANERRPLVPFSPDDSWPPEAHTLYERIEATSSIPIASETVDGLPLPFARAFALGKDWRWMYLAHAICVSNPYRSRYTGPGTVQTPHGIDIGDWAGGRLVGYKVDMGHDGRWSESYGRTFPDDWMISCNSDYLQYQVDGFRYLAWHGSDRREWYAWDKTVIEDKPDWRGATNVVIIAQQGHQMISPTLQGKAHGAHSIRFPNGDLQAIRYQRGYCANGIGFTCSPHCPTADYVGRTFDCRWRTLRVPSRCESSVLAHVIVADPLDDSPDARCFWHYVQLGLIGWTNDIRAHVASVLRLTHWPWSTGAIDHRP